MPTVAEITDFLDQFAPPRLAEDWDNVGLLAGDRSRNVARAMTCLTATPASAAEAIEQRTQLMVTHHPLPFQPLRRLTTETPGGRLLLDLIAARIAVYSPHTAFDSAAQGINQRLAEGLRLQDVRPLVPDDEGLGSGRWGRLSRPVTVGGLIEQVKKFLSIERLPMVGDVSQSVRTVAVACGSAGGFLEPARKLGCDAMLIGETRFHTCLEAEASGIALLLPDSHVASVPPRIPRSMRRTKGTAPVNRRGFFFPARLHRAPPKARGPQTAAPGGPPVRCSTSARPARGPGRAARRT